MFSLRDNVSQLNLRSVLRLGSERLDVKDVRLNVGFWCSLFILIVYYTPQTLF